MKNSRSFYHSRGITRTESGIEAELLFDAEHDLYRGHFPNNPITPGVCLIQSLNDLIEGEYRGKQIAEIRKCKFTAIHNPNEVPVVTAKLKVVELDYGIRVSGDVSDSNQTFLKYQATFQ